MKPDFCSKWWSLVIKCRKKKEKFLGDFLQWWDKLTISFLLSCKLHIRVYYSSFRHFTVVWLSVSLKETFHKIQNRKHFLSNRKKRRASKTSCHKMIFGLLNSQTDIIQNEFLWQRHFHIVQSWSRVTDFSGWFCLSNGNRNRKSPVHHLDLGLSFHY